MMNVKDIVRPASSAQKSSSTGRVSCRLPLTEVAPLLADAEGDCLYVCDDDGNLTGVIEFRDYVAAMARMFPLSEDVSVVALKCEAHRYSASVIARAVEDADANLLAMLTYPADAGEMYILLRVGMRDPSAVARSLERYGFSVESVYGRMNADAVLAAERLLELNSYLNV